MRTTSKALVGPVTATSFLSGVFIFQNPVVGLVAAATVLWAAFTHQRGGDLSAPPVLLAGAVVCAGLLSDSYLIYALVGANVVLWLGGRYWD